MRYVLGFDGGGTKTDCVLMDETGVVLARSRSGPSNPTRIGMEPAIAAVIEASEKAMACSHVSMFEVVSIDGGVSGVGAAGAIAHFIRALKLKFPNAHVLINSDLSMALSATGEKPSMVVIAGTGSAVLGRDADGNTARDGGFGPVLGDPGSAYDIGRKTLLAELRHKLKREESYLGNEILDFFKCDWVDLQERLRVNADSVLPKIFPLVAKAANDSDESAQEILRSAAEDLFVLVARVVESLNLTEEPFFLAKIGGVFNRSSHFDDCFDHLVYQFAPKARIGPLPRPVAEFAAQCAVDCLDSSMRQVGS